MDNDTIKALNDALVKLALNPYASVTLPDGRTVTYADIDKVTKLRDKLVNEIKASQNENTMFTPVYFNFR